MNTYTRLHAVTLAAEALISQIKFSTPADIDAGVQVAADALADGETGAAAIYAGYDHTRKSVRARNSNPKAIIINLIDRIKSATPPLQAG